MSIFGLYVSVFCRTFPPMLKRSFQFQTPLGTSSRDSSETMEKGQQETVGTDKKERLLSDSDKSDNEDSEPDDYNLTEDQRRALEELDNLKSELGYPGKLLLLKIKNHK